jgi:VWFA-related protein
MKPIIPFLLAMAVVCAQSPGLAPDTVIRINVNLVQVDAVVTDSKDKPVTNLRKEDFEILQDGKPQAITNFAFINAGPGGVSAIGAPAPRAVTPAKGSVPPPAMTTRPASARRTIALVVDDLGLSFESIARIRSALKKFVDTEMQPGDLVAVIRTGAGMGSLQQFTSDPRLLYAAIDHVKYNALGRVGVSSFAPLQTVSDNDIDTTSFDEQREQIFSAGTMGAINYVVEGLKELPGRKSVVLFSENMRMFFSDGVSQRVMDAVKRLTDAANRASVVIYSIDPRGLQTLSLTAADNTSGRTPQQISQVPQQRSQQMFDSQQGMFTLARETGGLFLRDTNDVEGALRKVVDDGNGYYLIGYHPDASTFDVKTGQPRFHTVKVLVKRPGLTARSRTGFFGTSDREPAPVAHTRQAQIAHALTSPFSTGALHVRLTTLFSNGAKAGSFINAMLYIDTSELKFTGEPDDWHKAVIDIVALTFGDNGQAEDPSDKTYTLRLRGNAYRQALQQGLIYSIHHAVKKAGAYQMRVVLRDEESEEVGSASQFIEVPDLDKGRLALSGIVLKAEVQQPQPNTERPNTERPNTERPNTDQGPERQEGRVTDVEDTRGGPAVRIFRPGTAILYGYQILNAQGDAARKAELEVQTRLFHDGRQIYEGKPAPPPSEGPQDDPRRLIGAGRLKLGDRIAIGDYVLQVIVTDKLAKEKYRIATQSMDFEIER